MASFVQSWKTGKAERSARIGFATPELLWQVLTAKRWELLKALCGAGPVSIREAARRVERDVKGVHSDVTALQNAGVLDSAEGGGSFFRLKPSKSNSCYRLHSLHGEDAEPFVQAGRYQQHNQRRAHSIAQSTFNTPR